MFLNPDTVRINPRSGNWETASLSRRFNGWCTMVERGLILLMPVMEGR